VFVYKRVSCIIN